MSEPEKTGPENPIRLLLVEDDEGDQMAFTRLVSDEKLPYDCRVAGSIDAAHRALEEDDFDIVIADYTLEDGTLFDLMKSLKGTPLIVTTGAGSREAAIKAMQLGASDYLIKDPAGQYIEKLPGMVDSTVKGRQIEQVIAHYRENLETLVRQRTARLEVEIEARREVEAALRASEQHLRSLLESADGFAVYRLASTDSNPYHLEVQFISPSIEEILGVKPEKFTPTHFFDNVHPDDLERVTLANDRAFQTSRFDEVCRVYNSARRSWRWIQTISRGIRDEDGEINQVNGIFIDVTEKMAAQVELKTKARDLENANIALNVLLENRKKDLTLHEKNIRSNMNNMVLPALDKLAQTQLSDYQKAHLQIAMTGLKEIMSSFSRNLSASLLSLSPAEIQVANFIKHGKSTKDIAIALSLSPETVKNHRQNIRKKMGLKNKKTNLRTHLLTLE